MNAANIKQFLSITAAGARMLASATETNKDDIGVELLEALAASDALIEFVAKYAGEQPEMLDKLVGSLMGSVGARAAAARAPRAMGVVSVEEAVAGDEPAAATSSNGPLRRRRMETDDYEARTTYGILRGLEDSTRRDAREARRALRSDPDLRRALNAKLLARAEDDGVPVDEDRPFLKWLIQNLPAIIKMIMELFGGVPTA